MAQTGTVTATELRLRSTPSSATNNNVIKTLPKGTTVQVLTDLGDWLKVSVGGQTGFVSEAFVSKHEERPELDEEAHGNADANDGQPPVSPSTLKPGPEPARGTCRFVGSNAVAPDGTVFGKRFKLGVFNYGATTIGQFVAAHRDLFPAVAPSRLRVMQAVSANEGRLEAINTWDSAFLTFGCFQWTVGVGDGAGELPALLARIKRRDASVFQRYFGQFGLDVSLPQARPDTLPTGSFTLGGTPLKQPAQKERLRTLDWAYRFWLAGHDDTVRLCEIEHAMERVDLFFRCPQCVINKRFVADYINSEYGIALLLDQHVNRPSHVPGTLARAVAQLTAQLGADSPQSWQDAQEHNLLDLYLQKRAQTSMTDSDARARRVRQAVADGLASNRRGSFQV